jgi:membrane-associated phospholipid phosphatase
MRRKAIALTVTLLALAEPAFGQPASAPTQLTAQTPPAATKPPALRYNLSVDLVVTGVATGVWGITQVFEANLAPKMCRWCSENSFDVGVRNHLKWNDTGLANTLSNIAAFGGVPATMIGLDLLAQHAAGGTFDDSMVDALVIAESAALAMDMNQTVKFIAGRERPFVHYLPPNQKLVDGFPADNNVSFYSGHTAFMFSIAVATGVVAHERRLPYQPLIWAVGLGLATATGYLRIAADKHWASDVLTGAVMGSAMGYVVPTVFHSAEEPPAGDGVHARLVPSGTGLALVGTF